jgi:hypothetical protein
MPTLQTIYQQAASVEGQTGVDPAIITALAQTEWGSNYAGQPTSLGIGTASSHGAGSGSAGGNGEAGQPSGFWTYQTGAEAASAFKDYISYQFPQAAQYLGNATQFFQAMEGTNYDVVYNVKGQPSSGRNTAAENAYWQQHINSAIGFAQQFGGQVASDVGTQISDSSGGSLAVGGGTGSEGNSSATSTGNGTVTVGGVTVSLGSQGSLDAPSFLGSTALGEILARLTSKGFWWSAGFLLVAGVLFLIGMIVLFRKDIERTAGGAIAAA